MSGVPAVSIKYSYDAVRYNFCMTVKFKIMIKLISELTPLKFILLIIGKS